MVYQRKNRWWSSVHRRNGRRKRVSLGTEDRRTADEMERMLKTLRDRRQWEILEAVADREITVGRVYDHWGRDSLDQLRALLSDVDLRDHIEGWRNWLSGRVKEATAERYMKQLRHLIPEDQPFLRSELTRRRITTTLHRMEGERSGSTVRRYHAAWSSFFGYLIDIEILASNPARRIRLPKENPPRERHLSLEMSRRLVEAYPEPHRSLAALREGAGVEIGAALTVRRRDIEREARLVHVHGTKNRARDRRVRVDDWAWAYIDARIRTLLPDALVWEITYDSARNAHDNACAALELEDYRMHDARHSYAVRHMKLGDDPFLIANQLGHKDASMVFKVYGKYRPRHDDFQRLASASGDER